MTYSGQLKPTIVVDVNFNQQIMKWKVSNHDQPCSQQELGVQPSKLQQFTQETKLSYSTAVQGQHGDITEETERRIATMRAFGQLSGSMVSSNLEAQIQWTIMMNKQRC